MALSRGLRLHQYLDDWLISQSQEEAQVNTQAVVDLTQSLGWIINQEKSELKPTQVFSSVGYEYHLDSALVKPTQERWLKLQDLILRPSAALQKIKQCHCLIILIAPGWPGMPRFWDLVQLSTEIPLQLPVSMTLLKQSHKYVFHNNPQQLNLHAWCLGADNSKNKASLWRWQRELLLLNGHQQGPSTNQSGPYLKNGAEKIWWTSPLHL